jgi:hypothetical protein
MITFANLFFNSLWPGLVVWSALYISDYVLTLSCARLYQAGVSDRIAFEGSYEITPYFQADIDSLRRVSPRFVVVLLLSGAYLAGIWWLTTGLQPALYQFALGAMILSQLAVHIRHVRNLFLFRAIIGTDAVRGRIEYSRPLVLRMSSVELLGFAGAFALLFVFTQSWFMMGGAIACLAMAGKHWRLARKHASSAKS